MKGQKLLTGLRFKLTAAILALAVVASVVVGVIDLKISFRVTADVVEEQYQSSLKGAVNMLGLFLREQFGELSVKDGKLCGSDGKSIANQYEYIDSFAKSMDMAATVFVKDGNSFVRVLTSLHDSTGGRAVGTELDASGAAYQAVSAGNSYFGEAQIFGGDYDVAYVPLTDRAGGIIGLLFVGAPTEGVDSLIREEKARVIALSLLPAAVILAAAIVMALMISGSIVKPIKKVTEAAKKIAAGDFQVHLDVKSKDEVGELADCFNKTIEKLVNYQDYIDEVSAVLHSMANNDLRVHLQLDYAGQFAKLKEYMLRLIGNLNETLGGIDESARQVRSGAEQVSNGAQALSQGATEQASSVEQLSASMAETVEHIRHNANNAQKARERSKAAGDELSVSTGQMHEMVAAMKHINDKSAEISKIIKIIDDIAFQTNILALNAAVEAARAGSAGKGFAVVADEVRNLAGKSAEAAKNTSRLIEETIQAVDAGSGIVNLTSESLEKTADITAEAVSLIDKIARESAEQTTAIDQINLGIEQISSVIQVNAATAEQSAAASQELTAQAISMHDMIASFQLKGRESGAVKETGAKAKTSAAAAVTGAKY